MWMMRLDWLSLHGKTTDKQEDNRNRFSLNLFRCFFSCNYSSLLTNLMARGGRFSRVPPFTETFRISSSLELHLPEPSNPIFLSTQRFGAHSSSMFPAGSGK